MSEEDTSKRERDDNDELLLVHEGVDSSAKRLKTDIDDAYINHGSVVDFIEAQSVPIVSETIVDPEKSVDIKSEQVSKEQKEALATEATDPSQPQTPQPVPKPATHANGKSTVEDISGVELSQVPSVSSVDPAGIIASGLQVEPFVPKPADPTVAATVTNPNSIVEERGEISAQYVGKVIGKGGEMLRDLQARSGCRLDVDQNVPHGNPRILTYRGTRKKVDLAKQMVATLCTPQGNETTLPLGSATRKDLVIPASSVGKIIGRSGEMVRELQSRSQAKIQVDHTAKAYKPDTRLVSIVGTPEAVVKAEEMVMFLVANPLMDAMKAIRMLVDDKMQRGGRWGSGPPYPNMPNQGLNMGPVESGFHQPPPSHQYSVYHQTGSHYPVGQPLGHAYGAPPPQQAYGSYVERGPETEFFPAAKMYMGRIIGQKGVTINDVQKRSGCDIQINQDVPPGQDCLVTIKGSRQGIEIAKQMLREIIEMGPNHPYAGGGGQFGGDNSQSYHQHGPATHHVQQTQAPIYGGYQQIGHQHGHQMYGAHQQAYGHNPGSQQYAPPTIPYGITPYQSAPGYPQQAPGYGAPPPQQQPPANLVIPLSSSWKSAAAADGQVYYYNEKTGETQWDKPAGMS